MLGRNGSGKSTLLQILSGEQPPDAGTVWRQPNLRAARLDQDVPLAEHRPVFDVVAEGLGDLSDLVMAYHHAAVSVAESATAPRSSASGGCSTNWKSATAGASSSGSSWCSPG